MSDLCWFDFADKSDVRARNLYTNLLDAAAYAGSWYNGWLRVKNRDRKHIDTCYETEHDKLWTGLEWVNVFTYEAADEKLYARLPLPGEIAGD